METKICIKCGKEKSLDEFYKKRDSKDNFNNKCITCINEYNRKYYNEKNREKVLEKSRKNYKENREKILTKKKKYREKNKDKYAYRNKSKEWKEKNKEYMKIYVDKNKEKLRQKRKEYFENHKKEIKEYRERTKEKNKEKNKLYRETHKEQIKEYRRKTKDKRKEKSKIYYEKNKEKIRSYNRKYYKEKSYTFAWRTLLKHTIKFFGRKKEGSTIDILGYSALQLKENIENKFTEGMSWYNYGEWHIDHIKPVSSFDKNTHPSIVNSLENLMPLWATTREINGVVYKGNLNKNKY